jgi:hypothetical protein
MMQAEKLNNLSALFGAWARMIWALSLTLAAPALGVGLFLHSVTATGCRGGDEKPPVIGNLPDLGMDQGSDQGGSDQGSDQGADQGGSDQGGSDQGSASRDEQINRLLEEVNRLQEQAAASCRAEGSHLVQTMDSATAPVPGGPKKNVAVPVAVCGGEVTVQVEKLNLKRRHVSVTVFHSGGASLSARPMPLDAGMEADRSLYLSGASAVLTVTGCTATGCTVECRTWKPAPLNPACQQAQ